MNNKRDWQAWHESYNDKNSDLSKRLEVVKKLIRKCLPEVLDQPFNILDLCSGDGRDLIGVLSEYQYSNQVKGSLIELDTGLANKAKTGIETAKLGSLKVIEGDAADTNLYGDAVPADLVMLCGIFGNISNSDVAQTIEFLPTILKPNAQVIWTRNRRTPDFTPTIRRLFEENMFLELDFIAPENVELQFAVGRNQFQGETRQLKPDTILFTFQR